MEGRTITMFRRQLRPYRLKLSMMPIQGSGQSHMMARLACSPIEHSTLESRQSHCPMLTPRTWHKVGALLHLWEGSTTSKVGTWSSGTLGWSSTSHLAPPSSSHHPFLCTQILPSKKRRPGLPLSSMQLVASLDGSTGGSSQTRIGWPRQVQRINRGTRRSRNLDGSRQQGCTPRWRSSQGRWVHALGPR